MNSITIRSLNFTPNSQHLTRGSILLAQSRNITHMLASTYGISSQLLSFWCSNCCCCVCLDEYCDLGRARILTADKLQVLAGGPVRHPLDCNQESPEAPPRPLFAFLSACHSEHLGQAFVDCGVRHFWNKCIQPWRTLDYYFVHSFLLFLPTSFPSRQFVTIALSAPQRTE